MVGKNINIEIDSDLWRLVSIRAAELEITKKEFVETALREKLERETMSETAKYLGEKLKEE